MVGTGETAWIGVESGQVEVIQEKLPYSSHLEEATSVSSIRNEVSGIQEWQGQGRKSREFCLYGAMTWTAAEILICRSFSG